MEVNRRGKSYRTALALIDAGVTFRSPRTAKNSVGKNALTATTGESKNSTYAAMNHKRASDAGVSQSTFLSGLDERSDSLHPTKQAVLNRLRESLKQLNSKGMLRKVNSDQDADDSAQPKVATAQSEVSQTYEKTQRDAEEASHSPHESSVRQNEQRDERDSAASLQSIEIPVGANNGPRTLASVNRTENNLVTDTVTSASVTSTNERVSQTIMPSTRNAVHNSGNATSADEQNNQTVAVAANTADASAPLASNGTANASANTQDQSDAGLAGAKVEARATEGGNMLAASLSSQQRGPSINSLASGLVAKQDSRNDPKANADARPEQELTRSTGTLAATPRTLKSLSNIKAAASSAQPTSLRTAVPNSKTSTLRNAKSAEVEERRKKLIIEARRKLLEIAQLEKRESDQHQHQPLTLSAADTDDRNQPSPTMSHRSVASAKSESYLRKLQRTDAQNDNVPLVARKSQARPPTSSPVASATKSNGTTDTATRPSKNDESQPLARASRAQPEGHPEPAAPQSARLADEGPSTASMTLPRNFHLLAEQKRADDQSKPAQTQPVAAQNALQYTKTAAKSQLVLTDTADERRSSPETVISVGAYQSRKVSATRSVVGNQNAVSVANLISELQPRSRPEARQMSLSTSSYTLAMEASTSNLSGSKSTIAPASEAARRAARRPVVKRNVCIQCNLMRNQLVQPPVELRKAARRNPPLSKILQHYELVTFSLAYSPDTQNSPVDFGIRLFESLFVEDLHGPSDDTPWSINGKRPVLAADSSAFKKVVRPQTDKGPPAAQQPNESLLAIDSIRENSTAHKDGRLCVGDYVVEVNGVLLLTQESAEAAEKLINASHNLVLVVARSLQQSADDQKNDKLINKGALSRALQSELAMLRTKYDRLKSEMKRNEVLISEMRNAVARKAKIRQVLKAQAADLTAKPLTQNAFKTIHLEEQLVHVV